MPGKSGLPRKKFRLRPLACTNEFGHLSCGRGLALLVDPGVGSGQSVFQTHGWLPVQLFADQVIVGIASANTERPGYVIDGLILARDVHDDCGHLINRDHFFRPDVDRAAEG